MDNSYEEIFDSYSEVLDSVPDQAAHQEADPLDPVNADDLSSEGSSQEATASGSSEAEQGSPVDVSPVVQGALDAALTPALDLDSSSEVDYIPYLETLINDNHDLLTEVQKVEGYNISILYTLYIGLALFISVVIVKVIKHFSDFS